MKFGNISIKSLAILAAGTVFLAGCNPPATADNTSTSNTSTTSGGGGSYTIKIGLIASVSGDTKPWGDDQKIGAELALKAFNDAGGVGGKKVEVVFADSASKPESSTTATTNVMSSNVSAIVGEVSSGNTIAIASASKSKNIPVVAVGATRTDLTSTNTNVVRVCYTDAFQGPVMAKFARKLNLSKVAVVTDQTLPYSQGLSESFIKEFKALGGTIVSEVSYQSGKETPNFADILTTMKTKAPEGIFASGYFTEVGPLIKQARAAGIKAKFMGGDGWDSDVLLSSSDSAAVGSFFCNHYNNLEDRPEVKSFLDTWKAANGGKLPSTTMGALGYDAMALTLDALKRAKDPMNPADVLAALQETENFKGVSGSITLKGKSGNPPKQAIIVEVTPKDADGNWQKFAMAISPDM
jgi:branched-chain amino acid transport system substrate-binding protein